MGFYIYNSLRRQKELFIPQSLNLVTMYVCGPTVYSRAHLGNARSAVVFDQLFRLLKLLYPVVKYARNITDVDDKINEAARVRCISIDQVTQETIKWYHHDMEKLNVLSPTMEPRATDHIAQMIDMIMILLGKGHAYIAQGHVLFRVASFDRYGALSKRSLEDQMAGARVEVASFKEDAADFVLWKPAQPPEVGWPSPWGLGRPGWHIECSAMGYEHLGFPLDIHCGGQDLLFPHHENEIAQAECATGVPCAAYWMHNGMLTAGGQKMSKSLGNIVDMGSVLQENPGEVIRYALLSGHYRQSLDWNASLLLQAKHALNRFYTLKAIAEERLDIASIMPSHDMESNPILKGLLDDLNTPKAFATLHELAAALQGSFSAEVFESFYQGALTLGLLNSSSAHWFQPDTCCAEDIELALEERSRAKREKNFALADSIRLRLEEQGITLEDRKDGSTVWRKA